MIFNEEQKRVATNLFGASFVNLIISEFELEENPLFGLYGDIEASPYIDKAEVIRQLRKSNSLIDKINEENINLIEINKDLEQRIKVLENVIRPDETDVHNINRRIELLAQQIAVLENEKGERWRICEYPHRDCKRVASKSREIEYNGQKIQLCNRHYRIMTKGKGKSP